jgi:hypothetical protein
MIYVGIDDTDTLETQGTNALARDLLRKLGVGSDDGLILRHQLFFDPRVPYTSHNGSASIQLRSTLGRSMHDLVDELRHGIQSWFVHGSDPGLCVTTEVPSDVVAFAHRCKSDVVCQAEARALANRCGMFLEGLGGTEQGVIGALAAVGLASTGEDGRVVHQASWPWPDYLTGAQQAGTLFERGIDEIRCLEDDRPVTRGIVDVGKKLRPNRRAGRNILFVRPAPESWPAPPFWQAVRLA